MKGINLNKLLKRKNPYLFKTKNINTAEDLVTSLMDATLSSSEEEILGGFLEELAIFVAHKTLNAHKSGSAGIDFEYIEGNTHFLVAVKSGLNWGNSSQWGKLRTDFERASRVLNQSKSTKNVKCILGACYGNAKDTLKGGIINQKAGQSFWYSISGNIAFHRSD